MALIRTQIIKPIHMISGRVNDLVTLVVTFIMKIANMDFVATGDISYSVLQTHPVSPFLLYLLCCIYIINIVRSSWFLVLVTVKFDVQ